MKNVCVIIQARMGSTRLSGKVMKDLCGNTVLYHVVQRVRQAKNVSQIVIATTDNDSDDVIAKEAERIGVKYFRGSESDVLSRYYFAAKQNSADVVVRITSDCPVIDPFVLDNMIDCFLKNGYSVVTNGGSELELRTFPRGLDVEIFDFAQLEKAFLNADKQYQREHVTPYIYENCENIFHYINDIDYSKYRWTLDTDEDLLLIEHIYKALYKGKHDFYMMDMVKLMEQNPNLCDINSHIEQKKLEK